MTQLRIRLIAVTTSIASALTVAIAPAAAEPPKRDENFLVTASRVGEPAYAIGSAYSLIEGADIERRQIRFLADVLRDVPGLAVNRSGPPGNLTQVRIRGSESNMTLVLIDGVKANDPGNFDGGFDFANLLALDVDRIEVFRGAQSAIWGSDAIGGVINIITRDRQGPLSFAVDAEGGSFGTTQASVHAGGSVGRLSASIGASRHRTDGISAAPKALGNSETDPFANDTAHGRLTFALTDNFSIALAGRIQRSEIFFDNPPFDAANVTRTYQRWGSASARLSLFDGHFESLVQASGLDVRLRSDFSGFPGRSDGDKRVLSYQGTLNLETGGPLPLSHRLIGLIEHERDEGSLSFAAGGEARVTRNTGYAGEYRIGFDERVFLTAGLRHDANDRFADKTTYRTTAVVRFARIGTRLHGSYGTGIKNPTLVELFGFSPGFTGNPNLEPETSTSADFGVEQSFADGRARFDVTIFDNRIDNRIEGAGLFAFNVSGRTRVRGIEFEAAVKPLDTVSLSASYTALDGQDPAGEELVRRPRHTASANIDVELPRWRSGFTLGIDYNGRARDRDFLFFPAQTVDLAPYTLVTLAGRIGLNDWAQLTFRVENLLDQDYEQVLYFANPGITAFGGISLKFGG